jgi:hypothetical protein
VVYFCIEAAADSVRSQTILIRSSEPRSRPKDVAAKCACPCIKHRAGFANSIGTRISTVAFLRVHSPRSGGNSSRANKDKGGQHRLFLFLGTSMQRTNASCCTPHRRLTLCLSSHAALDTEVTGQTNGILGLARTRVGFLCANGLLAEGVARYAGRAKIDRPEGSVL